MYSYAIKIHAEAGSFWSSCRDIPEAHSAGDTEEELLNNAVEGLEVALTIYVDQSRPVPLPTAPLEGERLVHLPALVAAKVALWNAMRKAGLRKADLAKLLKSSQTKVDRLVDFEHSSKIELVEAALKAVGHRLQIAAEPLRWIISYHDHDNLELINTSGHVTEIGAWSVVALKYGIDCPKSGQLSDLMAALAAKGVSDVAVRQVL